MSQLQGDVKQSKITCRKCASQVKNIDDGIYCDGECGFCFHADCIGISKSQHRVIQNLKAIKWFCDDCNCDKGNLTMKQRNEERFNKIESRIDKLDDYVQNLTVQVASFDSIKKDLEQLKMDVSKVFLLSNKSINTHTSPIIQQPNDDYKYHLILKGLKEEENQNSIQRHEKDLAAIKAMFAYLNQDQVIILDIFRIGKFDNNKHRMIMIKLTSVWDVRKILAKAYLLKEYKVPGLYIERGLSEDEKEKQKKIMKKRWEMMQQGTSRADIKIRNMKLFVNNQEVKI